MPVNIVPPNDKSFLMRLFFIPYFIQMLKMMTASSYNSTLHIIKTYSIRNLALKCSNCCLPSKRTERISSSVISSASTNLQ